MDQFLNRKKNPINQSNLVRMPALPINISNNLTKQFTRLQVVLHQHQSERQHTDNSIKSITLLSPLGNMVNVGNQSPVSVLSDRPDTMKFIKIYDPHKPIPPNMVKKSQLQRNEWNQNSRYTHQSITAEIIEPQKKSSIINYDFNSSIFPIKEASQHINIKTLMPMGCAKYPKLLTSRVNNHPKLNLLNFLQQYHESNGSISLQSRKLGLQQRIKHSVDYIPNFELPQQKVQPRSHSRNRNMWKGNQKVNSLTSKIVQHSLEDVLTDIDVETVNQRNFNRHLKYLQQRNIHVQNSIDQWTKQCL